MCAAQLSKVTVLALKWAFIYFISGAAPCAWTADMATCETCTHFFPDRINPEAGLGRCGAPVSHGYFFPAEKHVCRDHRTKVCSSSSKSENPRSHLEWP